MRARVWQDNGIPRQKRHEASWVAILPFGHLWPVHFDTDPQAFGLAADPAPIPDQSTLRQSIAKRPLRAGVFSSRLGIVAPGLEQCRRGAGQVLVCRFNATLFLEPLPEHI